MATTPSSSPPPPPPTLFLPPPDSTQPQISPSPQKKTQPIPWTHQETFNLIQAYQEKWYSLKKGQLKASQWEEVAITVAARCGFDEPSKSSTQCRHKIEKLRKRYRAERLKPYPNSWQYFDLMDSMERGPLPIAAHPVAMVECSNPNPNPNPNPSYSNSGKMSSQQQRSKGKNVAGSSESRHKRSRYGDRVPPAPHIPRGQSRRYGTKAVMESGRKWYSQHKESKYSADQFIDRASLMKEYPSMVRRIEALHMNFLFEQPSECNLSLVREFYANWDLRNKDAEVEVRGRVVTFTANCVNDLLGTPVVDAEPLKRMNVEPPYQHIRHLLCGTCSTARWIRHKESGTHVSLPFAHMNREARLWAKIIYACLVHGTHMTAVTRDRVCIIYALMREDIELNVGAIIFSAMRKARLLGGRRYGFGGLLTRFLRQQGVPEEDVDYKPPVNLRPLDFSRTKGPASYGVTLTMPERQARNDEITARMYGLTMLQLKIGGRPATEQEIRAVELDYPLGPHARTMLRIGPDFDEPLDDDVPTEEERRMGYSDDESEEEEQSDDESDYESEEEEQSDDGDSGDDFGDDEGADDDMTALVPFD